MFFVTEETALSAACNKCIESDVLEIDIPSSFCNFNKLFETESKHLCCI